MPKDLPVFPDQPIREHTVKYARMPGADGICSLRARMFLPPEHDAPHPLLIWFHSGGFRKGSIEHVAHGNIGSLFAQRGIATAFVQYRLSTPREALSRQTQSLLDDLQEDVDTYDFCLNPFFTGPAGLAPMEDGFVFFQWLGQHGAKYGLANRLMLGGSSAGAITALNLLFLPRHLGVTLPRISSAFVMSGAFAYPSFYETVPTRILAHHSPQDARVPIPSIRHFSVMAAAHCTLQEHPENVHGDLRLTRAETREAAIDRLIRFDQDQSLSSPTK